MLKKNYSKYEAKEEFGTLSFNNVLLPRKDSKMYQVIFFIITKMNNIEYFSKEMGIKYTLIIILIFLGGLSINPIKAQGPFSAKEQIKLLKIKNDLSKIERIASTDNFWYYLGKCKSEKIYNKGVIDKDGNVIIPFKYSKISYFPGLKKGVSRIPRYFALLKKKYPDFLLQHRDVNSAFIGIAHNRIDIFSNNGELLQSIQGNSYHYLPGYFIVDAKEIDKNCFHTNSFSIDYATAIINQNGHVMATNVKEFEMYIDIPFCKYTKICDDGVEREGIAHIYNSELDIPCSYHHISYAYDNGKYKFRVMKSAVGDFEPYVQDVKILHLFRDKGEELFEQKKYAETIDFYKDSLSTNPFAKLYTGISFYYLAKSQLTYISLFCQDVEGGSYFISETIRNRFKDETFDTKLAMKYAENCYNLLEMYLAEDTTYSRMASIYYSSSKQLMTDEIPNLEGKYHAACLKIEKYNNARQKKIEEMFSRMTVSLLTKNVSNRNNKGSKYTNSSASKQDKSTQGKTNENLDNKVQDRIKEVEQNLKTEEEYLQHAEKRYQSNPTSTARMAVEAHKKAIAGYKRQIEELKRK